MAKIDLGRRYDEPMGLKEPATSDERVHYPEIYYEGDKELDLPSEGTATITFKVVRTSEEKRSDGSERYCTTLQVKSIECDCVEEPEAPAKSGSAAADALDELMAAYQKAKESE